MTQKGRRQELLRVRIGWTATRFPVGWTAEQRQALLRRIVELWLETGEVPRGFAFTVSWSNPNNKNPSHADWKSVPISRLDSDEDEADAARVTLNRNGWLAAAVGGMTWAEGQVVGRGRGRRRTS